MEDEDRAHILRELKDTIYFRILAQLTEKIPSVEREKLRTIIDNEPEQIGSFLQPYIEQYPGVVAEAIGAVIKEFAGVVQTARKDA